MTESQGDYRVRLEATGWAWSTECTQWADRCAQHGEQGAQRGLSSWTAGSWAGKVRLR